MKPKSIPASAVLCVFAAASAAIPSDSGRKALDWGFEFASAIVSDEKDRSRAQESIVLEYALSGDLDEAAKRAERMDGWRQGVAFAEVAAELGRRGKPDEARRVLGKAEVVRTKTQGWQGLRIASHIAWAEAILGDRDRSTRQAETLAEADRQYAGKAAATLAISLTREENVEEALRVLAAVDSSADPDSGWWKFYGHIEASRVPTLGKKERRRLLDAGRSAAGKLAPWLRVENLPILALEYRKVGRKKEARSCLEESEAIVREMGDREPLKGPLAAEVARAWAQLGVPEKGRDLLASVDPTVEKVPVIEQPAVLANLAAAWMLAGDETISSRLLDEALDRAGSLVNARPRALAVVEICRTMGRFDLALTPEREARLRTMREGLGDPW